MEIHKKSSDGTTDGVCIYKGVCYHYNFSKILDVKITSFDLKKIQITLKSMHFLLINSLNCYKFTEKYFSKDKKNPSTSTRKASKQRPMPNFLKYRSAFGSLVNLALKILQYCKYDTSKKVPFDYFGRIL